MSKYSALRDHLQKQHLSTFELTFKEIEEIIEGSLPASASRPQWWANVAGPSSHVQREAWRAAGYDAFLISGRNRVKFQKVS
ncbi:DUF7662 domain-containing protein [Rhodoblastus sp.]|uniref:DUF7662 domain-containing protein n=1 Tax=Rhodoblastus sp. TaxID=1962975 RepID=UPI003F967153